MGKYCHCCDKIRSNEAFPGKGHFPAICKRCGQLPKEILSEKIILQELLAYWEQSNISKRNQNRIKELLIDSNPAVKILAQLTADVAKVKPHRRRRSAWLYKYNRDLYNRMINYFGEEYCLSASLNTKA